MDFYGKTKEALKMEKEECVELELFGDKYLIESDGLMKRESGYDRYCKSFSIYKNDQYWTKIEIKITGQQIGKWKNIRQEIDFNEFLFEIAPSVIKQGIFNNEITKSDGGKIKSFPVADNGGTPEETLGYYKNQADEIDKPRIGFRSK